MEINHMITTQHYEAWSRPNAGKASTWKKTVAGLLGGAVIATGAALGSATVLGVAPSAHADDASFLADMEAAGFFNHDGNGAEIAVGHDICSELAQGWTPAQAVRDLWFNGASGMDESAATQFVNIAMRDLCPTYGGAGGADNS
jgi:Protein of unknown function (DUF732)